MNREVCAVRTGEVGRSGWLFFKIESRRRCAIRTVMATDEAYILDLCDDVLGRKSLRQHRVDQSASPTLVAAYFSDLKLAIDFHSGKARADERRAQALAKVGLKLFLFDKRVFALNDAGRLARNLEEDRIIVRGCLDKVLRRR